MTLLPAHPSQVRGADVLHDGRPSMWELCSLSGSAALRVFPLIVTCLPQAARSAFCRGLTAELHNCEPFFGLLYADWPAALPPWSDPAALEAKLESDCPSLTGPPPAFANATLCCSLEASGGCKCIRFNCMSNLHNGW